jgi:hypothetical protein
MSLIRLEGGGSDIQCPNKKCELKFDVDWNTEYGDPSFGEHTKDCPECGTVIEFGVYAEYTQAKKT